MGLPTHTRADERVLFEARSPYQDISLVEEPDGHLSLTLDDVWQFHTRDEQVFHSLLADTPMMLAPQPRRALILGGGDGLALRNLLRYPQLEHATLVELDALVIEAARVPEMVALSENCFADPRVELIIGDALEFIDRSAGPDPYDLIICDFPAATSPELARLFEAEVYASLARSSHERSVLAVQVSLDAEDFWPVCAAVEASFPWLHPMLVNLDQSGTDPNDWASFVIASPSPREFVREASPASFMNRERLESLRILNREGARFETKADGLSYEDVEGAP